MKTILKIGLWPLILFPSLTAAECLHIGDSQSYGSSFQKTLSSSMSVHGFKTQTFSRVGSTTENWIETPSRSVTDPFPLKGFPDAPDRIPEGRSRKSWFEQVLDKSLERAPLDCVLMQLGDNDYGYGRKYLDLIDKNPTKAEQYKKQYIDQVKKMIAMVEQRGDKVNRCAFIGPTWKDRPGSYPAVTNRVKAIINQFQEEALKGSKCQHVSGMNDGLKKELEKIGKYTSDGLHLSKEAGEKWGQYVANSVIANSERVDTLQKEDEIFSAPKRILDNNNRPVVRDFNKNSVKEVDIRDYVLPLNNSIRVMSTKTGREIYLRPRNNMSIQVIGKAPWGYKVRVYSNGILVPGEFITATDNVKRGVNWFMINQFQEVERQSAGSGQVDLSCRGSDSATPGSDYNLEDVVDLARSAEPPARTPSPGEWKEGCDVLGKSRQTSEDKEKLKTCISSIQAAIISGNRNSDGSLDRRKVFNAMFSRLKPEEQRFAAMIFTAQGEVGGLANNGRYHEMIAVMKVLSNRVEMAKQRRWVQPFNELDIALFPSQFSMYNANETIWKRVIDPVNRTRFDNAIESFIRYPTATFRPPEEADKISHYHANYVSPSWRTKPVVELEINGNAVNGNGRVRHIFYRNVDGNVGWSARQSRGWTRP